MLLNSFFQKRKSMKYSLKATSIIESMIVLLIVVTGITGVYSLMTSSQKLANATERRIEAIQIARDGIEAFTNIRDTNWRLFAADYRNCWNTLNYNGSCVGSTGTSTDIQISSTQWIILWQNTNKQFEIWLRNLPATADFSNNTYRSRFAVELDARWFYTQGNTGTDMDPLFTREIQIDYLNAANVSQGWSASNNPKVEVTAIVMWNDNGRNERLEMKTILTNWKDS